MGENSANKSLLLGGLTAGALGLGRAIIGGIQMARGRREMRNLLNNRPQYTIPEAYTKALGVYGRLASSEMPGQQYAEDRISESTARAVSAAEKGAISSNVFQGAVSNFQDKELQAIQDLAKMGAEYKTQQVQNYGQALNQYGQLEDQKFEYNINQPWQLKASMAAERAGVGMQNLWGGMNDIASTAMTYSGTKYHADVIKSLVEYWRKRGLQTAGQ